MARKIPATPTSPAPPASSSSAAAAAATVATTTATETAAAAATIPKMMMMPSGDFLLFAIAGACLVPIALQVQQLKSPEAHTLLVKAVVMSLLAFAATFFLIPRIAPMLEEKGGLFGIDINKPRNQIKVPESLGIVPGTVYICAIILFQIVRPYALAEYNAALTSLVFMLFLGFADDVLDIRWRYKIILPVIATTPLLVSYTGATRVVVPVFLREYAGGVASVDLGPLYMIYMGLLSVFCSNAINILAGINGLEAGQSLIISASIIFFNLAHIDNPDAPFADAHRFSLILTIPFFFVTLALLCFNWFPSRVFVGDTYTLFAGMVFAVSGILGHFSETLLLLFLPQIINFVYSLPQLIGIVPCPRHRLPRFNMQTGLLEGKKENLNLVNATLLLLGPMSERSLCVVLLLFQMACAVAGLALRDHLIYTLFRSSSSLL